MRQKQNKRSGSWNVCLTPLEDDLTSLLGELNLLPFSEVEGLGYPQGALEGNRFNIPLLVIHHFKKHRFKGALRMSTGPFPEDLRNWHDWVGS